MKKNKKMRKKKQYKKKPHKKKINKKKKKKEKIKKKKKVKKKTKVRKFRLKISQTKKEISSENEKELVTLFKFSLKFAIITESKFTSPRVYFFLRFSNSSSFI